MNKLAVMVAIAAVSASLSAPVAVARSSFSSINEASICEPDSDVDLETALPKYGISDLEGRQIVPHKYFAIEEAGSGILRFSKFDRENPKLSPSETIEYEAGKGIRQSNLPTRSNERQRTDEPELYVVYSKFVPRFIDKTGAKPFDLEFSFGTNFKNGTSIVTLRNGKVGVIDQKGKFVVQPKFDHVHGIGGDFFACTVDTDDGATWIVLDRRSGKRLRLPSETTWVSDIGEGLIPYAIGGELERFARPRCPEQVSLKTNSGAKWGYIEFATGKIRIEPSYSVAQPFRFGLAPVAVAESANGFPLMGLINKKGRMVLKPNYASLKVIDGAVISACVPTVQFSTLDWNSETKSRLINREKELQALFRSYDVIGMDREKFHSLVDKPGVDYSGQPNRQSEYYCTTSTGCINERSGIEVFFSPDDRIVGWRRVSGGLPPDFGPMMTSNRLD